MGNLCYHLCRDINDPIRCAKCGDYYKMHYGGKSQRTSCRVHHYKITKNKFGQKQLFCVICNRYHSDMGSRNCYHSYFKD